MAVNPDKALRDLRKSDSGNRRTPVNCAAFSLAITLVMTETPAKSPRRNALLDALAAQYEVIRDHKPLALGIHKTIKERAPETNAGDLRTAMRIHTSSTRYLKALLTGKDRYNLEGAVDGEITDEQRVAAETSLKERFQKAAERRKTEAKAEQQARKEQEAEQRRAEKLNQLAERFKRR